MGMLGAVKFKRTKRHSSGGKFRTQNKEENSIVSSEYESDNMFQIERVTLGLANELHDNQTIAVLNIGQVKEVIPFTRTSTFQII